MNKIKIMKQQAEQWILEVSKYICSASLEALNIETKSNVSDLVTNVDKEVEQYFMKRIKGEYPTHYVLGEEGFGDFTDTSSGTVWIIDPIDGTMNFIHQQRHFAISLAVYHDGLPLFGMIYDVMSKEMYHAISGQGAYINDTSISILKRKAIEESLLSVNATWLLPNKYINHEKIGELVKVARGTRSYGCASLEMAYVATGKLDGYITPRLAPWDFAAGIIIAEEIGAIVTDINGDKLDIFRKSGIIIACEGVHEQLVKHYVKKNEGI